VRTVFVWVIFSSGERVIEPVVLHDSLPVTESAAEPVLRVTVLVLELDEERSFVLELVILGEVLAVGETDPVRDRLIVMLRVCWFEGDIEADGVFVALIVAEDDRCCDTDFV
jgi:hypothetical protein